MAPTHIAAVAYVMSLRVSVRMALELVILHGPDLIASVSTGWFRPPGFSVWISAAFLIRASRESPAQVRHIES